MESINFHLVLLFGNYHQWHSLCCLQKSKSKEEEEEEGAKRKKNNKQKKRRFNKTQRQQHKNPILNAYTDTIEWCFVVCRRRRHRRHRRRRCRSLFPK